MIKAINDVKAGAETKVDDLSKKADNELKSKEKAIQMEYGEHKNMIKGHEKKRSFRGTFGRKNNRN